MFLDLFAAYWLLIKVLFYVAALIMLVSGIDDLVIDLGYWWMKLRGKIPSHNVDENEIIRLAGLPQQPIAIMVPAWQEYSVIHKMVQLAVNKYDYSNYHLFVGTYPNDQQTQDAVDSVADEYPHIHKVVCSNPGPTTKADCLNHVIEAIFEFEKTLPESFTVIAYHDAEDVIHPLELQLFNSLVPQYDLVQVPVFPLPRPMREVWGNHYMDEFGEYHSKDVLVREFWCQHVSSAGVGTAFSRKAIATLHEINQGVVFNTSSLTEDYEISMRLRAKGLKEHFALMAVADSAVPYLSVREFFPKNFNQAVRQKSRWVVGIVFQGWRDIGWTKSWVINYFLMRDRKAVVTNPVNLLAYFLVLNIIIMATYSALAPKAWHFPNVVGNDWSLQFLLMVNAFFLFSRAFHRCFFSSRLYGISHGLQSIPRMIVANVVNFFAYYKALRETRHSKRSGTEVAWDKTDHEFPDIEGSE